MKPFGYGNRTIVFAALHHGLRVKPGNDAERMVLGHYVLSGLPSATRSPMYRSSMA